MRRNFKEFKNKHVGEEIWIIGGGPSLNYIDPSFFDGKLTMGCNEAFVKFQHCTYYLKKDGLEIQGRNIRKHIEEISPKSKLIVSDHYGCAYEWPKNEWYLPFDYWYFEHPPSHGEITEGILENMEGQFANGIGIMAIAMHLSVFMGIKNIILCGNDSAFLDGKDYFDGYCDHYESPGDHAGTIRWAKGQSEGAANYFRSKGINIYGLSPFINLSYEGHNVQGV